MKRDAIILRPSAAAWLSSPFDRRWLGALAVALLGAVLMGLRHPGAGLVLAVLVSAMLLLFAIPVGLYLASASISLEGGEVYWRKVIRRGHFRVEQVKGAAYDPRQPLFVVVDRQNRRLLRLHTGLWPNEELQALAGYLGQPGARPW